MRYLVFSILVYWISFSSFSQSNLDSEQPIKRFTMKLSFGQSVDSKLSLSNNDWRNLKNSIPVADSFNTQLNNDNGIGSTGWLSGTFSVRLNKNTSDKFTLNAGFNFGLGPDITSNSRWIYTKSTPYDTLISSQTGTQYYVDDARKVSIDKVYRSKSILLGAEFTVSTNPNRIFMFQTGLRLNALIGVSSKLRTNYTDESGLSFNSINNVIDYTSTEQNTTSFNGFVFQVPLDISFRLSKKKNVAKDMRLGFELNPGVSLINNKSFAISNFYYSGGLNFRYSF